MSCAELRCAESRCAELSCAESRGPRLIVTVAALLTVCEVFSRLEVENRHFRQLNCDCRPIAEPEGIQDIMSPGQNAPRKIAGQNAPRTKCSPVTWQQIKKCVVPKHWNATTVIGGLTLRADESVNYWSCRMLKLAHEIPVQTDCEVYSG